MQFLVFEKWFVVFEKLTSAIYSKIAREIMWLPVHNMHTIISVMLLINFRGNSHALFTITSLVGNDKLDMWSFKISIIIHSQRVQKASIILNFKSLYSQFHVFALFGINWHALGQSECSNYRAHIIRIKYWFVQSEIHLPFSRRLVQRETYISKLWTD